MKLVIEEADLKKMKVFQLDCNNLTHLIGILSNYLQGFIHPRWLAGFLPSTVLALCIPALLFRFSGDLLSQITTSRQRMLDKVQNIAVTLTLKMGCWMLGCGKCQVLMC